MNEVEVNKGRITEQIQYIVTKNSALCQAMQMLQYRNICQNLNLNSASLGRLKTDFYCEILQES